MAKQRAARQKSEFVSSFDISARVFKSLAQAVLDAGGSDEDLRRLESDLKLKAEVGRLIVGGKPVGNIFSLICEGTKTSELVKRGKYDWANDAITSEHFPIEAHPPVSRTVELVEFYHDPTSKEVLHEFARRGLERPTYEDALVFGVKYPEEQRKHPVVFLHEPVQVGGSRDVLVLDEGGRGRGLDLYWFDDGWNRSDVFPAVRK